MGEYCVDCGCPLDICCGERFKADLKKAIAKARELRGKTREPALRYIEGTLGLSSKKKKVKD